MKTTDLGHPKSRLDTPRKQPPNGHLRGEPTKGADGRAVSRLEEKC